MMGFALARDILDQGTFWVRSLRSLPVHRELLRIGGARESDVYVDTSAIEEAV